MEHFIIIQHVEMVFDTARGPFHALKGINLDIAKGEFISLIGHSGCGKSTLLNLIAGLTLPSSGVMVCDGREIHAPGPDRAVVFQNHSLLPWMTCYGNIYLGVERVFGASETKSQLKARTQSALELVGLPHAAHKHPHEISGGMKQRVGIARALAMEPKLLLMDEPFGALDALTRARLQDELQGIVAKSGATVVMVTHDVDEAVLLSDRIVMLTNGPAATIGEILTVDLPRPRERLALSEDPHYAHLRAQVLEFLYKRQAHPQAKAA
ncbi:Nitrate transport protein NasD [Thiomonas arsenitoxydans]|uniref:Nitrate transport ATP-binding protein nrtD n=1 Tax=Thiomonas arsenitoxydans (strain DSM 22701 / CIP 110005 / 3As) TaxID=426114 RepID=D6CNQ4_THIA3|nr:MULTISPECIES: ABC transporter ATP-binding protein [Thiomonas]CAZ90182.1 Nitrate transport ATP-binding protein nrtD [Thiomonas arsenitoxydans]CDW93589.1 Nitrate transport protein NasD [Thiomonas sp. CB2]CQR30910.1 Nitrate transport protein NasD [Thiomonas arsenitoxydans]CQR36486.1 Nitrate transport protein NasD [Thiomonas arsenitoxydans]CQR40721.1 Nitrate transport protein NasD [Thiomonas arsenitoxydans]